MCNIKQTFEFSKQYYFITFLNWTAKYTFNLVIIKTPKIINSHLKMRKCGFVILSNVFKKVYIIRYISIYLWLYTYNVI